MSFSVLYFIVIVRTAMMSYMNEAEYVLEILMSLFNKNSRQSKELCAYVMDQCYACEGGCAR